MAASENNGHQGPLVLRLRMLQLLARLANSHGGALPRAQLAEELEVDERTLRRDVQQLAQLVELLPEGLPFTLPAIRTEASAEDGRAMLVLDRPRPTVSEIYQYAAVYSAVSHLRVLDPAVLGPSADGGLQQLAAARDRETVRRVQRAFYYRPFGPKDYDEAALDVLEDVVQGLWYQRPITVSYRALNATRTRKHKLEPYTLVLHRDGFYVLGQLCNRQRPTTTLLALSRIEEVTLHKDLTFEVPADFDPERELSQAFGVWRSEDEAVPIQLAFESDTARAAAERRWPGSGGWSQLADGRRVLHLKLPVTPELIVWILSWRESVEVLEPQSLRQEVVASIQRMLARYGVSADSSATPTAKATAP